MNQEQIPVAKPVEPTPQQSQPQTTTVGASGRALAALILGILSLVCMGFATGIPAIIIGNMELKAIRRGEAPKAGEGIAKVGLILGIIGSALTCLITLGVIAMIVLGISMGAMESLQTAVLSI